MESNESKIAARVLSSAVAVLFSTVAVLVIASCSAGQKDRDEPLSPPDVTATPTLADMRQNVLPIEAYLLNRQQSERIQEARQTLVVQCMRGRGFDFSFPSKPVDEYPAPRTQSEQRYQLDPARVAKFGYKAPPSARDRSSGAPLSAAESAALTGTTGPGEGADQEEGSGGGCFGEADRKFRERDAVVQDSKLVVGINVGNMQRSMQDPRVESAFGQWSQCMRDSGYAYATPMEASGDPKWSGSGSASAAEIATALADIECMRANNVVGVWFAVESAYEDQEIQKNAQELADYRTKIDNTLRFVAEVTGGAT